MGIDITDAQIFTSLKRAYNTSILSLLPKCVQDGVEELLKQPNVDFTTWEKAIEQLNQEHFRTTDADVMWKLIENIENSEGPELAFAIYQKMNPFDPSKNKNRPKRINAKIAGYNARVRDAAQKLKLRAYRLDTSMPIS